ncbi:heptaprenylglyceryl phosphate synthase [Paenibacillus sp. J2TS4]|uniref:heptaprenylglyceryl phosphate synthase n=1 Tax=Paenibacillus sp. J2TS4 TaxID=2807194 RepID=UPI001B0448B5|nr:heptaprenylglyceryl phosphate synthase [Paenibacillus sp. J2TS4]GIP35654.1 heptaprenylglyceryl phosphate synthase [Paenibacillus sp. J2TS4]
MELDIRKWKHVFKLDPDRTLSDEALEKVCQSGTDAIMVGGSSGVTFDNTVDLLSRIRRFAVNCVLEISVAEAIVPGFDLYLIPVVLNTSDGQWITGFHQQAIREYGAMIDWDTVIPEGYIIMNEQSTVAAVTGADSSLDDKDLAAYARMADKLFRFPVVYIEYSGRFGNIDLVKKASQVLEEARLFYGGGIDGPDKARLAAECADTIVVGNIIYDDLEAALATVEAVKS